VRSDWHELAAEANLRLTPPPRQEAVREAEQKLGCHFASSLRSCYQQTDAVTDEWGYAYILPVADLVQQNQQLRTQYRDLYMSFDDLIAFGQLGNGDLFFQPLAPPGNDNVFVWDHEDDSRRWYATDVADAIRRFARAKAA
jgi:hypothetical protein